MIACDMSTNPPTSKYLQVENTQLHYLEAGQGEVVLLIHGFPTSSYLWRDVMPKIAETHRVMAIDLPGYGKSDKPLDASYSLNFYSNIISGFLAALQIDQINLVVHDLGGPIGLLWAVRHPEQVKRLGLLNTLVYSNFSWGVILFSLAIRLPVLKHWLSSPSGIAFAMKIGVHNKARRTREMMKAYQEPFIEKDARKALVKTASNISIKAFKEIEEKLPQFTVPIRIIYGEKDWILPKVKRTMERVQQDLPHANLTSIPDCGHFLQEDKPELLGDLLSDFLNETA